MKSNSILPHALILAGGLGTRFKSVSPDLPKCLYPINQRPFICLIIDHLLSQSLTRISILSGIYSEEFKTRLAPYYGAEVQLNFVAEEIPLGTGGAIKNALNSIVDDQLLVLNGDTYCQFDLEKMLIDHQFKKAEITVLGHEAEEKEVGIINCGEDGRILSFSRQVERHKAMLNSGIYLLNRSHFLQKAKDLERFSFEKDILERGPGEAYFCSPTPVPFFDMGTPEKLVHFLTHNKKNSPK